MKEVSQERLIKDARRVLENPFWIPSVEPNKDYARIHDDHDGTFEGRITIMFSKDGDAWFLSDRGPSLRFRNQLGGGMSPRVRNALMILAWAIELDNEERPQEQPQKE